MIQRSPTHINISLFRGWLVVSSAIVMGLVLGILYSWSVIKAGIPDSWNWTNADKALPYSVMCIMFSLIMVPAGRLQDRFGPRWVVFLGGLIAGLGCIISGLSDGSKAAYIIGFGGLTGIGVGSAFSALTPPAIKWFPPQNTGVIVGFVVAGNGLAPVFLAPLTIWLLRLFATSNPAGVVEPGVSQSMIALGVLIWLVVLSLAWLIENPPPGFTALPDRPETSQRKTEDTNWGKMLRTPQFWLLYLMYFAGASAGLTFISVAADLGKKSLGQWAFIAVVVLAVGNTVGRIIAGIISDHIGRQLTLFGKFLFQGSMIFALYWVSSHNVGNPVVILAILFFIGVNYGANLAIFPAVCKDQFGLRYFGLNYGSLFTAWGLAGLIMPWLNGAIKDMTGNQDYSYLLMIGMMIIASVLALISKRLSTQTTNTEQRS